MTDHTDAPQPQDASTPDTTADTLAELTPEDTGTSLAIRLTDSDMRSVVTAGQITAVEMSDWDTASVVVRVTHLGRMAAGIVDDHGLDALGPALQPIPASQRPTVAVLARPDGTLRFDAAPELGPLGLTVDGFLALTAGVDGANTALITSIDQFPVVQDIARLPAADGDGA